MTSLFSYPQNIISQSLLYIFKKVGYVLIVVHCSRCSICTGLETKSNESQNVWLGSIYITILAKFI